MTRSPIDEIEVREGMRAMAYAARCFLEALREEGFDELDAMQLTCAWLTGIARSSSG